jgi:hypothetical protein
VTWENANFPEESVTWVAVKDPLLKSTFADAIAAPVWSVTSPEIWDGAGA